MTFLGRERFGELISGPLGVCAHKGISIYLLHAIDVAKPPLKFKIIRPASCARETHPETLRNRIGEVIAEERELPWGEFELRKSIFPNQSEEQ